MGVRIKGTLGDIDPHNKLPFKRAISRVTKRPLILPRSMGHTWSMTRAPDSTAARAAAEALNLGLKDSEKPSQPPHAVPLPIPESIAVLFYFLQVQPVYTCKTTSMYRAGYTKTFHF